MDDLSAVFKVILLTLVVIVAINYGIIRRFTQKKNNETYYWSRVLDTAKNPWQKGDQDLDELAKLVEQTKRIEQTGRNSEEINQHKNTSE